MADGYPMLAVPSNDYIGQAAMINGFYEADLLHRLVELFKHLSQQGIALDVGANIGNHSVFLSAYFEKVIAFEPNPLPFEFLKFNSKLTRGNITPYKFGLSDTNHQIHITNADGNLGKTSLTQASGTSIAADVFQYDCLGIDESIALVKIDVEGHELNVLRGTRNLLAKQSPVLIIETELPNRQLELFLFEFGYRYFYQPNTYFRLHRGIFRKLVALLDNRNSPGNILTVDPTKQNAFPMLIISKNPIEL